MEVEARTPSAAVETSTDGEGAEDGNQDKLSTVEARAEEAERLANECSKAINHLLPAELAILQRLDGIDDSLRTMSSGTTSG